MGQQNATPEAADAGTETPKLKRKDYEKEAAQAAKRPLRFARLG